MLIRLLPGISESSRESLLIALRAITEQQDGVLMYDYRVTEERLSLSTTVREKAPRCALLLYGLFFYIHDVCSCVCFGAVPVVSSFKRWHFLTTYRPRRFWTSCLRSPPLQRSPSASSH
jgi:hypothetical protein